MIEFENYKLTNEDIKELEDSVNYISHKASISCKHSDGSFITTSWEMSISNDGSVPYEKLINFLRIGVKNRINYDLQKGHQTYYKMVQENKK